MMRETHPRSPSLCTLKAWKGRVVEQNHGSTEWENVHLNHKLIPTNKFIHLLIITFNALIILNISEKGKWSIKSYLY